MNPWLAIEPVEMSNPPYEYNQIASPFDKPVLSEVEVLRDQLIHTSQRIL